MKMVWAILTIGCILTFSTSTGTYLYQKPPLDSVKIIPEDTIERDTVALMNVIQPLADSFALEAVRKIDSVSSRPRFFVKRVDVERRVEGNHKAWITIYKRQSGVSRYDTTLVVEIPE
jgi:hypothetical protein